MRGRQLSRQWSVGANGFGRVQASQRAALSPRKLVQQSRVRWSPPNIEALAAQQMLVRRDTQVRICGEENCPLWAYDFSKQREDSVEGKREVHPINGAMNIDHIVRRESELLCEDFLKIAFRELR